MEQEHFFGGCRGSFGWFYPITSLIECSCSSKQFALFYSVRQSHSLHLMDAEQRVWAFSQQAFCSAKVAVVYTTALLAQAVLTQKRLQYLKIILQFVTVSFQVFLDTGGYFYSSSCCTSYKISIIAFTACIEYASNGSWYQLPNFESGSSISDSKNSCWALPKPDIQHKNCAGYAS